MVDGVPPTATDICAWNMPFYVFRTEQESHSNTIEMSNEIQCITYSPIITPGCKRLELYWKICLLIITMHYKVLMTRTWHFTRRQICISYRQISFLEQASTPTYSSITCMVLPLTFTTVQSALPEASNSTAISNTNLYLKRKNKRAKSFWFCQHVCTKD